MRVEVLYVAGCPSHRAAVAMVREVLDAQGVAIQIEEVLVKDGAMASELRFPGSPTIRINGRDVAGEPQGAGSFALSCRLYSGSKQAGLPRAEMIHRAVIEARQGKRL